MKAFVVDPGLPIPPYEQVRSQIATAIETGALPLAARLPTVRSLAAELGIAVNTVAKAYRHLEISGLIETHGRSGSFVAGAPSARQTQAMQAAQDFARRMHELGIGDAEALAILRREVARLVTPVEPGPESE